MPSFQIGSSSFLQAMGTTIKKMNEFYFRQIHPRTADLAALERLEILHRQLYLLGRTAVTTQAPSILMDLLPTCSLQGQQYRHRRALISARFNN